MKKLETKDAARLLNLSVERVRQLANEGQLRSERIGSSQTRVYDRSEVERLKAAREDRKKKG